MRRMLHINAGHCLNVQTTTGSANPPSKTNISSSNHIICSATYLFYITCFVDKGNFCCCCCCCCCAVVVAADVFVAINMAMILRLGVGGWRLVLIDSSFCLLCWGCSLSGCQTSVLAGLSVVRLFLRLSSCCCHFFLKWGWVHFSEILYLQYFLQAKSKFW